MEQSNVSVYDCELSKNKQLEEADENKRYHPILSNKLNCLANFFQALYQNIFNTKYSVQFYSKKTKWAEKEQGFPRMKKRKH